MERREKQLKELYENGMFYSESKKLFRGEVDEADFFNSSWSDIINSFGYYPKTDGNAWVAFVTDSERGTLEVQKTSSSEEEAVEYLISLAEKWNFIHYSRTIMDDFDQIESVVIEYLKQEYNYSKEKAKKAIEYLLQVKNIAFEFYQFVTTGDFLPEKFACNFSGYTAKRIKEETNLTILGAFNYMIYLDHKPEEALANIKKGLPRRTLFNENELRGGKKDEEEKSKNSSSNDTHNCTEHNHSNLSIRN